MDISSSKKRLSPLSVALLVQVAVFFSLLVMAWLLQARSTHSQSLFPIILIVQGGLAALLGSLFGLRRWWLFFQILLPPALALGVWIEVPSWIYGVVFLTLLLIYWNSADERVPLYLTNQKTWAALQEVLPDNTDLKFVDLGCGLGGGLGFLASQRPLGSFTGIESAPALFLAAWLRWKFAGAANVHFIYKNFWKEDLAQYDAVYCFLSPAPMGKLYEKVRVEMRPGSLFISNSFEVPDFPAHEIITVDDSRATKLHIWRM